jgi:hypothetical protein
MLARLPKPIVIAMAVLAACFTLPIVWVALLSFLIGDGSELSLLLRFGLLVAGAVGLKRLVASWKEAPPSLEPLRETGVAIVKTVPPLARAIGRVTIQLFDILKRTVIYLRGCRWPIALNWFGLTLGIVILQSNLLTGIFILFLGAPFWPILTVNLGFAHLIVEPAMRNISPRWSLVGLAWFAGYAAISIHGHIALDRLSAEVATENSRPPLPFDPRTQALVVVHGSFYGAPSAEGLSMAYSLPVVYEERPDAGDAAKPTQARDGRPRFTATRLGPPELCDSITGDARLKAVVTRHFKMFGSTPFCSYETIEAPELPVIRLGSSQDELRIVGAEGVIDRITLTSGGDERQVASVKAAPYQYLPMPVYSCFINSGAQRWDCSYEFLKERQRAHPDNVALVGQSLGLAPSTPASRSEQIRAAGSAALERARDLSEEAAAAELDRLLAHPIGSTAQLSLKTLSARPDLIASRADRLAVAAAEALTTRDNWRDVSAWSDLMVALPDADFGRVGPGFVDAMLARWTDASKRHFASLSNPLIYRLADLGPTALPLLERIYRDNNAVDRVASIVALCRMGAPAADLTEKISARILGENNDAYAFEMREAVILALMRQGRNDLADAGRQQYEQWAQAVLRDRGVTVRTWSEPFEAKRRTMTPSSSPDACIIPRR